MATNTTVPQPIQFWEFKKVPECVKVTLFGEPEWVILVPVATAQDLIAAIKLMQRLQIYCSGENYHGSVVMHDTTYRVFALETTAAAAAAAV